MYEATFDLEAITPVFMRGADQRQAEFRSASVKGVMRWWFRALAGAYLGNDIKKLREVEGRIFGSAGSNGSRKSRVTVFVKALNEPGPLIDVESIRIKVISNKKGSRLKVTFSFPYNKAGYLFFSVRMELEKFLKNELGAVLEKHGIRNKFRDKRQLGDKRQLDQILQMKGVNLGKLTSELKERVRGRIPTHYPPGSRFQVTISSSDREAFVLASTSLWLAVTYGGFGFRARRGAGSLRVVGITWDVPSGDRELKQFLETLKNATLHDLERILENKTLNDAVNKESGKANYGPSPQVSSFPTLSKMIVLISERSYRNHSDALRALQEAYAGHYGGVRFEFADRRFSHEAIKRLRGGETNTEYRYYFGTPVIYANWETEVRGIGRENSREKEFSRRASSVILTVKKIGESYYPVVVILPYQYLPMHRGKFLAKSKRNNEGTIIKVLTSQRTPFTNEDFVDWITSDVLTAFRFRGFRRVYP